MAPQFFNSRSDFRKWLEKNHAKATEVLVGFYKRGTGKPSMTWPESVDQALSFGWIDGMRRRIDDQSYSIRFTPRKADSIWSGVNIKKAEELIRSGKMRPAGLEAFKKRKETRSRIYSYENKPSLLSPKYENVFRRNKKAWAFFTAQAPSYQQVIIHRIMTAKQEKTRLSRLAQAICASEEQKRVF